MGSKVLLWVVAGAALMLAVISACGPATACQSDLECREGERCDPAAGLCVLADVLKPLTFAGGVLPQAEAGKPYAYALASSGGVAPFTWQILDAGVELAWLQLDGTTGELGGTPAAAAPGAWFDVAVTDSKGAAASATFELAVVACTDCPPQDGGTTGGEDAGTNVMECVPGTVCRASEGACDAEEVCSANGTCPANALKPTGTECRASAGVCDPAETCTGTTPACPADVLAPAATECRASAGACDPAEACTGSSAVCPADQVAPAATVCRAAAGGCDFAESCDGSSPACPPDVLVPAATVCHSSVGGCDPAETCSGTSPECPADRRSPAGTVCRAAAGTCDVAEVCDGARGDCPMNLFQPATTVCRSPAGACDAPETCTGNAAECPSDRVKPAGTACRGAANSCDVAESCDGAAKICPQDTFASASTQCAPQTCSSGNVTYASYCAGTSATCRTGSPVSCNGFTCGGSACKTTCGSDSDCLSTHFCQPGSLCAPKRADGQYCSGPGAGRECSSGVCQLSYADADMDGFGTGPGGYFCGASAPAGRSLNNTDCCDADARRRPGQTQFFTSPSTACGTTFDFDCSGRVETQYAYSANACQTSGSCSSGGGISCGGNPGWATSMPSCGGSATYVTSCGRRYGGCGYECVREATETRTQGCH